MIEKPNSQNPPSPHKTSTSATLLALLSILLWCWSGVCFRKGGEAIGAMAYLTCITAGGSLTAIALHRLRRLPLSDLYRLPPRVIVAGFLGVALYTIMLAAAFALAAEKDVGQINLLNYLWPMWIVLLGAILLGERPRALLTFGGALLGFSGVALSRGLDALGQAPESLLPHLLALAGGFLWALYSVLLRRWRVPEEQGGTALHFAVCAAIAAAIAAFRGEWAAMPPWSASTFAWVFFGAVGPVGLAYHFWEIGVKRGAVHLIATLAYAIPICSSLLIGLFFHEAMSPGLLPGAILIAAGAYIAKRGSK